MIASIEGISPLRAAGPSPVVGGEGSAAVPSAFSTIFQSAIDHVRETDAAKNQAEYLLATGQLDNPAELTIATTRAQLSVDLLVQLRNKALEAYTELTRINL